MAEKTENIVYAIDNLTSQLVSFKIDGNNFNLWSKQFVITITSKNKLECLSGDEAKLVFHILLGNEFGIQSIHEKYCMDFD